MSVTGLCGICGRARATFVCERCGTPVCDEHYDTKLGLCSKCAAEVRAGRGELENDDEAIPDDDSWNR